MPALADQSLPPAVSDAFAGFPEVPRAVLLALRARILEEARGVPQTGGLTETLKWGQPAYLPAKPRVGTTLRLGLATGDIPALFVHCQTRLLPDFRALFPDRFTYDGARAVHLPETAGPADFDALAPLIRAGLTYHLKT